MHLSQLTERVLNLQDLEHCIAISSRYLTALVIPVLCKSQQFSAAAFLRLDLLVFQGDSTTET